MHAELRDLDVEVVVPVTAEDVPLGAKGIDPFSLGVLLITLTVTGGVFTVLIETARDWLADTPRHGVSR